MTGAGEGVTFVYSKDLTLPPKNGARVWVGELNLNCRGSSPFFQPSLIVWWGLLCRAWKTALLEANSTPVSPHSLLLSSPPLPAMESWVIQTRSPPARSSQFPYTVKPGFLNDSHLEQFGSWGKKCLGP